MAAEALAGGAAADSASKGGAAAQTAGQALNFLGNLGNTIFNFWALDQQIQENRKTQRANERMYREAQGLEQERFEQRFGLQEQQFGLQERAQRFGEREAVLARKERAEDKKFNRMMDFTNRFTSFLNSQPQLRQGLVNLWRK